jgi:hypothetical protein
VSNKPVVPLDGGSCDKAFFDDDVGELFACDD